MKNALEQFQTPWTWIYRRMVSALGMDAAALAVHPLNSQRTRKHGGYFYKTHGDQRRERHGFVLPLTLWIIALMGLAVAAINTWVSAAVDNARALQMKVDDELAMTNFKNELIYDLGTRPMGYRGVEIGNDVEPVQDTTDLLELMVAPKESSVYISLDGRPYIFQDNPDYIVQLYDARGLINLNSISTPVLQRFLSLFGVPETLRNQLPDTLADWIDDDDLTRLAGAEKTDYERLSRHPPNNVNLVTPMEAQSILGWDKVPAIWKADLDTPLFTTCAVSGFNPNTASETALLTYIPGMTKENTAQVLIQRAKEPFRSARDFIGVAGVLIPDEAFFLSLVPGGCVIVNFTNRTTNEQFRFSLSLLRIIQGQPWQVDYAFHIPSQYRRKIDGIDPAITFPTPSALDPGDQGSHRTPGIQ